VKRREFIRLLGGVAAWPLGARAQQERVRRIGILLNEAEPKSYVDAFVKVLQTLGWHEGRNLRLDIRWKAGDPERIRSYAEELVAMAPDLIVSSSTGILQALMRSTRTKWRAGCASARSHQF
jgi:putative ABC transport system substrate-binding protein